MTTTPNPITPPAELVQEWWEATPVQILTTDPDPIQLIAAKAAQWGYQQAIEELETFLRKADDKG